MQPEDKECVLYNWSLWDLAWIMSVVSVCQVDELWEGSLLQAQQGAFLSLFTQRDKVFCVLWAALHACGCLALIVECQSKSSATVYRPRVISFRADPTSPRILTASVSHLFLLLLGSSGSLPWPRELPFHLVPTPGQDRETSFFLNPHFGSLSEA